MLVLSRSEGQAVVISGGIVVEVLSICRGRVKIGISAPASVSIHREEVQQRVDENPRVPGVKMKAFEQTVQLDAKRNSRIFNR